MLLLGTFGLLGLDRILQAQDLRAASQRMLRDLNTVILSWKMGTYT